MLNQKQNKNQIWKMSLIFPLLLAFLLSFNVETEAQIKNNSRAVSNLEFQNSDSAKNSDFRNLLNELGSSPLYVIAGKKYQSKQLDGKYLDITGEKMNILLAEEATVKFGSKAKDGAIILEDARILNDFNKELKKIDREQPKEKKQFLQIQDSKMPTLMSLQINSEENSQNPEPLYILNGEKTTKEIVDLLDKEKIENVKVLKGEDATALYGEEGRNGVVIITTKKTEKAQNTSEKVQKKLSVKTDTATSKAELKTEYKIVKLEYIVGDQDIPAFQRTDLSEKKKHLVGEAYKTNPQIIMGGPGQPSPLVIIDGKKETAEAMKALKPVEIKGIRVLKDEAAIEKYGEDALEGVIEITTRKQEEKE